MELTRLTLDSRFTIGAVSPFIYGGFLEHLGRSIYQGVYDPDSTHADEDGFRADVVAALRELGMTIVRYPGGNFVSGYHWRDGIGDKAHRPTVRELPAPRRLRKDRQLGATRERHRATADRRRRAVETIDLLRL